MKGIVIGASSGAAFGGAIGAFVVALPGLGWAVLATTVGVALGGYAGAVIGSLFASDAA